MSKTTKATLYLFFFGLLSLIAVFFRPTPVSYTQSDVLGQQSNVELFIEPEAKREPLLTYIHSSTKSIALTMYLLSDEIIITALKDAASRGVEVKVILEQHPFGGNSLNKTTKPDLEQAGIAVSWGRSEFPFTHQKTLLIDNQILCVLNLNMTKSAFVSNREYNICEEDQTDVAEARAVFDADWQGHEYVPKTSNLVVSPQTARGKLEVFFSSAVSSVDLVVEVIDDPYLLDIFMSEAKDHPVRILLPDFKKIPANKESAEKLARAGVSVRLLTKPYLHAKAAVVDNSRAYVGSVNMTTNSLDENREMGILIGEQATVSQITSQFESDWLMAEPLLVAN